MFRKLVSNLPFSPALVGQIGFYARRLRKEEATRRIGLFMTVLALIVQSFTVFVPSTSANASSTNDLIPGGISTKQQVLSAYDTDLKGFKKIMTYNGITRAELDAMVKSSVNSRDYGTDTSTAWKSWGHNAHLSTAQGEVAHRIDDSLTVYSRPLWRLDTTDWTKVHGSTYPAFVGNSAVRGKFAILFLCGNLVTRTVPTPSTLIKVCRPGNGIISIYSNEKKATDLTPNDPACQPKTAQCNEVVINKKDRTHMSVTAKASGTATITSYVFTVRKDTSQGAVVATKTTTTSAREVTSDVFELKDAATYYVSVIVKTSIGDAKDIGCSATITVLPPEKCDLNTDLLKTDPECKPCPGNHNLWYKAPECREVVVENKTAQNLTQNADASKVTANAGDRVQYTLTISNPGKVVAAATFVEDLEDVLEYATIQDNGGGSYNPDKKTLSWPAVQLAPGAKQTRTFVVAVPAKIPSTAQGSSEPTSYDCVMNNTFGDNVQVKVKCETPKIVEQTIKQLPSTGPAENMMFAAALLSIATFFWARSRQLGTEVRLVRKDFSASTI